MRKPVRRGAGAVAASASVVAAVGCPAVLSAQVPPQTDPRIYDIVAAASPERVEADIRTLAGFGTRNTFSDTLSATRGIGAARRWIKAEFERISEACGGCYEVVYQRNLVTAEQSRRIPRDTWVVNVLAIKRGTVDPGRYVIMSGDIDSRASNGSDGESDAPGANDNASGMAGAIEAARLLAGYEFGNSVVLAGLSGEEQGLWGGQHTARVARDEQWKIVGVLNNDMIGNIEGVDGVIENNTFRVFSEPTPVTETEAERRRYRVYGGEVDGPSRQLARYVASTADAYIPNLDPIMIYRLDRFGRGGHHRPFNDQGFAAVRIMETHENYTRQHQNIRTENGIAYGDVIEGGRLRLRGEDDRAQRRRAGAAGVGAARSRPGQDRRCGPSLDHPGVAARRRPAPGRLQGVLARHDRTPLAAVALGGGRHRVHAGGARDRQLSLRGGRGGPRRQRERGRLPVRADSPPPVRAALIEGRVGATFHRHVTFAVGRSESQAPFPIRRWPW